MNKRHLFLSLCFLLLSNCALSATKGADISQCEKQMLKILSTTLDCNIELQPDTLDEIVEFTGGAIQNLHCSIPLRANKSAIYNHWITQNMVALPTLPVHCKITGAQDNKFTAMAKIRPVCKKIAKEWSCQINMSDIQGLGFLGKPLEAYVNTNQTLLTEMSKHLTQLSEAP